MFRCPKCHVELPADAKFCKSCGFNQTNARMMVFKEQGGPAQAQPPRPMPPQPGQGAQPMRSAMPPQPGQGAQPMRTNTPPQAPGNPQQQQNAGPFMPYSGAPNAPQAPRPQQPGMPPQQSPALQPGMPPQPAWNNQNAARPPEQIVRSSTPPNAGRPVAPPQPVHQASPLSGPREALWDGLTLDDLYNDPAMMATSQAAEHWRESWRMRQKAEAGPAVGIARGQAAVAEPLLAMQHSIARMRAVLNTNTKTPVDRSKGSNFWIPLILMSCIILGLIAYTATTFKDSPTTTIAAPVVYPSIQVNKTSTTTYVAGADISIIGKNFSHNSTVAFSLNSSTANGQARDANTDKKGNVATTLTVPTTAQIGTYFLTAIDGPTKATTSLSVHVLPANLAATNPILNTSPLQETDVTQINFTASPDQPNPKPLDIHLKNPSNATVLWSALAFSDYTQQTSNKLSPIGADGVSWLVINHSPTIGQIQSQGTDVLSISASAMNLPPNPITKAAAQPYVSYVVINTVDAQNQPGQMVLKVTLLVKPTGNEVVVTPSPTLVMQRTASGNCVDNTITITNLGSTLISYTVQAVDGATAAAFTFGPNATGAQIQPIGSTNPDGTPSDVQAVKVSCHNVQAGDNLYAINVFPGTPKPIKLNVSIKPA